MLTRIYQLNRELEGSVFLFGARQTGKSTLLRQQFPAAIYVDLLDTTLRSRFRRRPSLLYEMLKDKQENTLVIVDEIPEVPELLNEVHRLISQHHLRFVLCGSSARKLKRKGHNTLGGRACPVFLFPLVSAEIPGFDVDRAVSYGMLPSHYLAANPWRLLSGYIDVYLKEEIKEAALVRNLNGFQRFLEVAALTSGEMVNYNNIAQDCGVSATTVKAYFDILDDTLVGRRIPAYEKRLKRRLVQAPRFYYFDVGIVNYLLHRKELKRGTPEYGHAFEHLVVQEIVAYMHYRHVEDSISYWRTYTGIEVDLIIGEARVAIEIKSVEEILAKHLKNLKVFAEEYPDSRRIVVSLDVISRTETNIECMYVKDFFQKLWEGGII